MTKLKKMMLPMLMMLIIPCAMLFTACKGGAESPLVGDWKLQSVTYVQDDTDETVEVGEEVEEGITVEEGWLTLKFTKDKVTITIAMGGEHDLDGEELGYSKVADNKFETEEYTIDETAGVVAKLVFTRNNDNLKVEKFMKEGEEGEYTRTPDIKHFMVVKGTVEADEE